jgi:1-acyl-sn-glycerol-3-phosphate acyltransferase
MTRIDTTMATSSWPARAFYALARACCVGFCRIWMRMTVEGHEHVPAEGGFVLAPVHRSNVDTPIASVVTRRRLRYMGKDTLWQKPFWRWFLSALGGFPVSRGTIDLEALSRCVEVLKGGEPVVLFPEGERKSGPVVQPLLHGAAYVAARAGVPILPVGIGGSERAMPKGSSFVAPRKVHVIIGRPIEVPAAPSGRVPRDAVRKATAELHEELQTLFDLASLRAGAPHEG